MDEYLKQITCIYLSPTYTYIAPFRWRAGTILFVICFKYFSKLELLKSFSFNIHRCIYVLENTYLQFFFFFTQSIPGSDICLSVHLFTCLSSCLPVCRSVHLFVYLSVWYFCLDCCILCRVFFPFFVLYEALEFCKIQHYHNSSHRLASGVYNKPLSFKNINFRF